MTPPSGPGRAALAARMALCAVLPRGVALRRTIGDGVVVQGPNRAGHGGRGVFLHGASLEPELARLGALVGPGDVVVDVGANIGVYSLLAARIVGPTGVVVGLEPNPSMLAVLHANARRNGFDALRVRGLALGDANGEAVFYENFGKPNSFSLSRRDAAAGGWSVLVARLDDVVAWERLPRVDLVKIDAEGGETAILAGGSGTLARHRPLVIAEVIHGGLTGLPDRYEALALPGSPNQLLVPAEHPRRQAIAAAGWRPA